MCYNVTQGHSSGFGWDIDTTFEFGKFEGKEWEYGWLAFGEYAIFHVYTYSHTHKHIRICAYLSNTSTHPLSKSVSFSPLLSCDLFTNLGLPISVGDDHGECCIHFHSKPRSGDRVLLILSLPGSTLVRIT